jgi:hypothetical protein
MAKIGERIVARALELLTQHPDGLRYSELLRRIAESDESFNTNTIQGNIWNLDAQFPKRVYKPSRGLFRLIQFRDERTEQLKEELVEVPPVQIEEADFYKPFADWLVNEIEDCTKAIPLGRNRFRDKWGTPDVVGKRESKRSDIIQAPVEIISAEIKTDTSQLVTAFGQACAYNLFSHKTYLVIPKSSPKTRSLGLIPSAKYSELGWSSLTFETRRTRDLKYAFDRGRASQTCSMPTST